MSWARKTDMASWIKGSAKYSSLFNLMGSTLVGLVSGARLATGLGRDTTGAAKSTKGATASPGTNLRDGSPGTSSLSLAFRSAADLPLLANSRASGGQATVSVHWAYDLGTDPAKRVHSMRSLRSKEE